MLSSQHLPPPVEFDSADMTPRHTLPKLPAWTQDPSARPYLGKAAVQRITLTDHPSFVAVSLYLNPDGGEGGCIIHQTSIQTVLALEFADSDELGDQWHDTVRHYAKWWAVKDSSLHCA